MTDFKPFTHDALPVPTARSVTVILDLAAEWSRAESLLFASLGSLTLLDRALECLAHTCEADARIVRIPTAELASVVERSRFRSAEVVLSGDPKRAGDRLATSSHALVIDGRHPFLRPGTIDEAIRLVKMRVDVVSLTSVARTRPGWWFEEQGSSMDDACGHALPAHPLGILRECHAFHVVRTERLQRGSRRFSGQRLDPCAFEVAASEAFRIDSEFDLQLAAAWAAARPMTQAA